jgi:circadian clock protein KaiB
MYELKLYIVGRTPKSIKVVSSLKQLLEDALKDRYSLEVIDVIENPELAEQGGILATPTLEKVSPEPARKVIGYLSDKETVLTALGLTADAVN